MSGSREMPKYQSIKHVWALKIKALEPIQMSSAEEAGAFQMVPEEEGYEPIPLSAEFMKKHEPQVGGYYVVYSNGYTSFSPAKAFEEGHRRLLFSERIVG